MKKIYLFLFLAILIFPLSACNNSKKSVADKDQTTLKKESNLDEEKIERNQTVWKKKISKLKMIYKNGYSGDYVGVASDMKELQVSYSKKGAVIKGIVYNLEEMKGPKDLPLTKASIFVDKVIAGKKSLRGEIIQVPLKGGVISTSDFLSDRIANQTKQNLLVQEKLAPLPEIGGQVIIRLMEVDFDDGGTFNNYLKEGKFNTRSYNPVLEQCNYWIKNPNMKKFALANTLYKNQSEIPQEYRADQFQKLTDELNEKFNK